MPRFLSGIQPSGLLHLGNYFGAIKLHLELQREGECFFFIADYHALTTVQDAAKLREWTREVAVTYLALGLDTQHTVFWKQSDVPEVTELAWFLASVTGVGLLERSHAYKDKIAKGIAPGAGLFFYPVLMAADILSVDADFVPVGQDQIQHVEMAQDMAGYFNGAWGQGGTVLKRPEWKLSRTPKVVGLDGQKMSKSYNNYVWIFEEGKTLKKQIGRIATDSRPPDEPKDPAGILLFDWLALLLPPAELADLSARAREGGARGPGYGELKQRLCEAIETTFAGARRERQRLLADPAEVDRVLAQGAERARAQSRAVVSRARKACGID
jgi:tryptophanyl-tRNA synthetase